MSRVIPVLHGSIPIAHSHFDVSNRAFYLHLGLGTPGGIYLLLLSGTLGTRPANISLCDLIFNHGLARIFSSVFFEQIYVFFW